MSDAVRQPNADITRNPVKYKTLDTFFGRVPQDIVTFHAGLHAAH